MAKVSIIIPARNEKYLTNTVRDIYEKATGDFEVIIGLNGPTDYPISEGYPNLIYHVEAQPIDLKVMINKLVSMATGKYIYKTDAHCMFAQGFDEVLQADMQENWVVTPRFFVLDAEKWQVQDLRFYDYFYLHCPFTDPKGLRFKAGGHWSEKTQEKLARMITETPSMHGSGWFVSKEYYQDVLKGFPEVDDMGHAQEPIWLGLKAFLLGGSLMVNKKTWYAHLHQDSNQRGYSTSNNHTEKTYNWTAQYWLNNSFEGLVHNFEWFVDKFMPMPGWPENWKEIYNKYKKGEKYE